MNIASLMLAIQTRAKADTGAGGLFNVASPLVNDTTYAKIKPTKDMPYIMFTTAGGDIKDCFQKDVTEPIIRMAAFVDEKMAAATTRGAAILERIRGDSSGGSAPSYGFHRWVPGSVGGWDVGAFMIDGVPQEEHGDEYYSWVVTFRTLCSK
jgi:hypothetical protein